MNLRSLRHKICDTLFGDIIQARVQAAVKVVDDKWWTQISGAVGPHDKGWSEMQEDLSDALQAWRTNPLARRIVGLTTDYVVGDGISITSDIEDVNDFIKRFWHHRKNHMPLRLFRMCDELTRAGELFIVLSTNPADGMTYIRFIPASRINQIETDPNDLGRELRYHELTPGSIEGRWWTAYNDGLIDRPGPKEPAVLHYAINRPVGATRGEGDLTPILPWLRRYKEWLEDRVRVNRFKNAFLWQVTLKNAKPGDIQRKQNQYKHPPSPGSILVTDENETWQPVQPNIQAEAAEADGKALRLMVAAGAGIPLHFLSEGESATKATAAEMADPTFRHYYHRQLFFVDMLKDLVKAVYQRAVFLGKAKSYDDLGLSHAVTDLTTADNKKLADAAKTIVEALATMKENNWIDDETAISLALKFAGEIVDPKTILARIQGG
ncbi:MAG: hypothetical protein ACETWB_09950 [Anaerolineae bacterium]